MPTKSQLALYWREWAAVRRLDPTADRHGLHEQALGYDVSSRDLTNEQFDRILASFRAVSRPDDLNSQLSQLDQERRRTWFQITVIQVSYLAALMDGPPERRMHDAEAYIQKVARAKFGTSDLAQISTERWRRFERGVDGKSIWRSDLETLRDTLAARIGSLRRQRGMSVTELKTLVRRHGDAHPVPTSHPRELSGFAS